MKILLVHPDDLIEIGPWSETAWNLIVDLGWSGRNSYAQQAHRAGSCVLSIYDLLDHREHRMRLRELVDVGLDQVVDSESVDWWEAFSASVDDQLGQLMLLLVLAQQLPEGVEIVATRPHFATHALSILLKREIKAFSPDPQTRLRVRATGFIQRSARLRPSQALEVAFDKWDTDYRLRRLFTHRPSVSTKAAILLPSAYVNVSRAQLSYAEMLPHRRFLLVVTRRSGRRLKLPANVELRSLAAYSPGRSPSTERERIRLLEMWQELQKARFAPNPVLGLAIELCVFDTFASFLQSGLRIRDAWREAIRTEPITAVLSADENNAFTRLPVTLAKSRKLRTVYCDHGALNMSFAIRRPCSDVCLASGEMARNYFVEWCGLPAHRIIVGGPNKTPGLLTGGKESKRDRIVFFSAAYELFSARTQILYSELLPELCSLAREANCKVIVKLHPFESRRVRKTMIDKALRAEERGFVELREGPVTPDMFERVWFSVTVESSVAVESTMNGVPCFLCGWFDGSWYEYGKQFAKYSAGYWLDSPQQVRLIPQLLPQVKITDTTRHALHSSISPEHLESVLSGT